MYHIKVRISGKWQEQYATPDIRAALEFYNAAPVPRMILGHSPIASGILHKQYSDNGFIYNPEWAED